MGMGGAFVAMAQGPMAQYWNPGGLAMKSSASISGMEIPVTVGIEATGDLLKNTSEIGDMANKFSAMKTAQRAGTSVNADQVSAFVKTLTLLSDMNGSGKGAMVEAAGGVNFKFSKVAISINNFTSIGLNPYVDVVNIGLGAVAGYGGSGVTMRNVSVAAPTGIYAAYAAPTTTLAGAISALGGYTALATLICGGPGCLNTQNSGIIDNTTLANALVNQAINNGLTVAQVTDSANQLAIYAPGAKPVIQNAASGNSYANNTSNLAVDAASFTEIALGYGKFVKFLSGLSIGANIKMINGQLGYDRFQFMQNSDTKNAFKMDNIKTSWAPAVDLGFLWDMNQKFPGLPLHPKLGFVVRNINNPKFDLPDMVGGKYTLDRQARLGLALHPAKFWNIAVDMDVTKNKTEITGYNSRQLAVGTEINIFNCKAFNIPLRAGIMKNLADSSSKMAYTVGTGINLLYLHFDVAGAISSDRTTMDTTQIPTRTSVSASIGLLF